MEGNDIKDCADVQDILNLCMGSKTSFSLMWPAFNVEFYT